MTGKTRNVFKLLVEKPFDNRPLGRADETITTFTIILGKCDNERLIVLKSTAGSSRAIKPIGAEPLGYTRVGFRTMLAGKHTK
jgi:hypothetical protein